MTWPKKDRIRWAEWRLREWDSIEAGRRPPEFASDLPTREDLNVWLAKERDGLSWQQIAIKHFPQSVSRSKAAGMSMTRRAHKRIEQAIAPTGKKFMQEWLDVRIKELFGCTPEEFKKYLRRK